LKLQVRGWFGGGTVISGHAEGSGEIGVSGMSENDFSFQKRWVKIAAEVSRVKMSCGNGIPVTDGGYMVGNVI
jgi:hypothetical protein